MYRYDEFDAEFVNQRVAQFRDQVKRRIEGDLTEDEFKPLRLMNGLYLQLHAYMLRVAIPYGTLSAEQMYKLADIADKFDKGYGHFTTRQNIQFNWPKLKDVPDILDELASIEMHAIQTSGNCIRNVTTDQWAGVAADEIEDPRPVCELIRQWSTLNPEFAYLPRKFKIAVTGSPNDRAVVKAHDIGIITRENEAGEIGYKVLIGGGLGRTPFIGKCIKDFVSKDRLLTYLEAIMRVYNLQGRRDNKYKARIKILTHETGVEKLSEMVEQEFKKIDKAHGELELSELNRITSYFKAPAYSNEIDNPEALLSALQSNEAFSFWYNTNVAEHQQTGYCIVNISLKPIAGIPGDATSTQMRKVAQLANDYSLGEIRVTHEQNLVLPYVKQTDLFNVWQQLEQDDLGTSNLGLITDIIACPGLDYCALATARSIPVAQEISKIFADRKRQQDIGKLQINISGCINACGHHHVGNIGILGLDKKGQEYYQITLGGNADQDAAIGKITGPGFSKDEISGAIETVIDTYLENREQGENFIHTHSRIGDTPFKEALYGSH